MKYFIDTEFIEDGPFQPLSLISIGIVREDGEEFYKEWASSPLDRASDWVRANVVPHLTGGDIAESLNSISSAIRDFIGTDKPEFWGYYADYDWVVFCQIFGRMIDLPKGWPMYCRDIKQLCDDLGNPELPPQSTVEHNALNDARWNREAWAFLIGIKNS